jgi:magnesium transporter
MLKKPGSSPGTIVYTGKRRVQSQIDLLDYNEATIQEKKLKKIEESVPFKERPTVTWLNVTGLNDISIIEKAGKHFGLHPLVLEDIASVNQRTKYEEFDDYLFVVLKMASYNKTSGEVDIEQVSLIVGDNFVITFQEREGDVFEPVRERLRGSRGKIRKKGGDYLAYALMDAVVDNYFTIFEGLGETIEELDTELIENPNPKTLKKVYRLKRELGTLRKSIWPLREVLNSMQKSDSQIIKESTNIYLRDVYDHTIQVMDTIETMRDTVSGMLDIYLSSISNRMNEVMKVLTIIATIFIPLTFIAGIYGMNFDVMPELHVEWAYYAVWGIMLLLGLVMVAYFRKKGWV